VVVAVAAVLVSACTAIPTTGQVHAGQQPTGAAAPNVRLPAGGPVQGDSPEGTVKRFRFANSDLVPNFGVAKLYLVDGASWQPQGVEVVDDAGASPTTTTAGDSATVKFVDHEVGEIAPDGTYQPAPAGTSVETTYELTTDSKEKGQWRIKSPPAKQFLTVQDVENTYQKGWVYFLRPDQHMLVPVRVFLPVSRDDFAQALMTTLLHPPPVWLSSAVTTAFLPRTTVKKPTQDHVTGITTVDLSRDVASLSFDQRSAIAAQISYTLANSATVSQNFGQLKILSGGQPLISGAKFVLQTAQDDWSSFDPDAAKLDYYYSDLDHLTRDHLGNRVPGDTGVIGLTKLAAPAVVPRLTPGGGPDLIAGVVQLPGNTMGLYAGPLIEPKKLLVGSSFTTPSFDALGNLWTVQQETSSSPPKVRIAPNPAKAALQAAVAAPELANKVIEALKVSRDGTRVAVLAASTNASEVLVGAVAKDGSAITHFFPVAPSLTAVTDFAWASSTQLVILGPAPNRGGPGTSSQLWSVDIDGWPPSLAEHNVPANAETIAAAPDQPLVIGTANQQIDEYRNDAWVFVDAGSFPRYPG
jgi:hypothetical protein